MSDLPKGRRKPAEIDEGSAARSRFRLPRRPLAAWLLAAALPLALGVSVAAAGAGGSAASAARDVITLVGGVIVPTERDELRVEERSSAADQYRTVVLCHRTGNRSRPFQTITVSRDVEAAHRAHGDFTGPCEGKIRRAFVSSLVSSTPVLTLPPGSRGARAHFIFSVKAAPRSRITTTWFQGRRALGTVQWARTLKIIAAIRSRAPLPANRYTCVLRVKVVGRPAKVLRTVSFRIAAV